MDKRLANYVRSLSEDVRKIIGWGPSFPFDVSSGQTEVNDGLERINQSIFIILTTPQGEVWFNPEFGSNLHKYVFHPINETLKIKLRSEIIRALSKNEPRITVLDVSFDESQKDENILNVLIRYQIIGTNIENVYVYPFHIEPSGPFE